MNGRELWRAGLRIGLAIGFVLGVMAGYALGQVLPGPDGSFKMAALNLAEQVPPESRPYTRYLSLYAVPEEERDRVAAAAVYWANSLSYRRRLIVLPAVADGTLLRIDLRDLGWDRPARAERRARFEQAGAKFATGDVSADVWEALAVRDVYFEVSQDYEGKHCRGWIDPAIELSTRLLSRSSLFIVRAETFLVHAGFDRNAADGRIDGLYSDFLLLPTNEADLYKALGVNELFVGRESIASGGAVIQSGVARHNRVLEFLPTLLGGSQRYLWRTYDVRSNLKAQSVLDTFLGADGFSAIRADGGELIWELPNGLQGYYLIDGQGRQVGEVPTDVAQRKAHPLDVVVYNGWTCVSCHSSGINSFADVISALAIARGVGLAAIAAGKDKQAQAAADRDRIRLEDYYLSRLQDAVGSQQGSYQAAVKACNGLTGVQNAAGFVGSVESYHYGMIDLTVAAREMGLDRDQARAALARSGDAGGLAIVAGQSIARDRWEHGAFAAGMRARTYEWEARP